MASDVEDADRRDFLVVAGGAFAAIGAASLVWPFIDQMNPDAGAQALASIEVDIAPIEPGQAITVQWRGKPVFIRNRTDEEINLAKGVAVDSLPDPLARNPNLPDAGKAPATDVNRTATGTENWLVLVGICTHLGCIPKGQKVADVKGSYGGWFCPCHGSHYDTAGRIRKGPAPRNLDIPPYEFVSKTKIKIG